MSRTMQVNKSNKCSGLNKKIKKEKEPIVPNNDNKLSFTSIFSFLNDDDENLDLEPLAQPPEEFAELSESEEEVLPTEKPLSKEMENYVEMFGEPGTYIFSGPTDSGKTFLVRAIAMALVQKKNMFGVYVFSTSANLNNDYNWLPPGMVFNNNSTIEKDLEQWFKKRKNEQIMAQKDGGVAKPCVLIVDDPTGTFANLQNVNGKDVSPISTWATKIRKTNTYMMLQCQRWNTFSTIVRDNCHAFVLIAPKQEELKTFHNNQNMSTSLNLFLDKAAVHFQKPYTFLVGLKKPFQNKKVWLCDAIKKDF